MFYSASASSQDVISQKIEKIELSVEIAKMVGADQAYRFGGTTAREKGIEWKSISEHPDYQKNLARIDSENAIKIKTIIKKYGWPKISDYGKYTARNTWLLIQHMDTDVAFQEKILLQMKSLLPKGEVIKSDYAYLVDRVQVNHGKLQIYGTQGDCVGKRWQPKPIENIKDLDLRRSEMELPSMEEYQKMFKDICT